MTWREYLTGVQVVVLVVQFVSIWMSIRAWRQWRRTDKLAQLTVGQLNGMLHALHKQATELAEREAELSRR
jgi:hypothetical protein